MPNDALQKANKEIELGARPAVEPEELANPQGLGHRHEVRRSSAASPVAVDLDLVVFLEVLLRHGVPLGVHPAGGLDSCLGLVEEVVDEDSIAVGLGRVCNVAGLLTNSIIFC